MRITDTGALSDAAPVLLKDDDGVLGSQRDVVSVAAAAYVSDFVITTASSTTPAAPIQTPAPTAEEIVTVKGTPTEAYLQPGSGAYQWHLNSTWGVRASEVWNISTGAGVKVAVFDDGFDYNHSDLSANYLTALDYDTLGNDNDAARSAADNHGTAVAGMIAADDNGTGMVGVAFDANIVGIRRGFGANTSFEDTVEGFNYARTSGAKIMNNSWGSTAPFSDHGGRDYYGVDTTDAMAAIKVNMQAGVIQVFAAGNSRSAGDNVNYHSFQNNPYVITVGGTDINGGLYDASTPGDAILISAPGESVWTTDATGSGGYVSGDVVGINGTSFAAPTVAGVLALMAEVNPNLTPQMAMEILAMTARKNDPNNASWQDTGTGGWNGGAMHFSHDYGFGLVDARAAVAVAEFYAGQNSSNFQYTSQAYTAAPALALNDANVSGGVTTSTITVPSALSTLDVMKVRVDVVLPHARAGDLQVILVSPSGTESILVDRISNGSYVTDVHGYSGINFTFTSNAFMYENANGNWTLKVIDKVTGATGTLSSWGLTFVGDSFFEFSDDVTGGMFFYTDEFANATTAQRTISTATGMTDTLSTLAVSGDVIINTVAGSSNTTIAGKTLTIAGGNTIEFVYTGWGNDTVYNSVANSDVGQVILTGRGNDTVHVSVVKGRIDGGLGTDTVTFATKAFASFTSITYLDGQYSFVTSGTTLTVKKVENFVFQDVTYSSAELQTRLYTGGDSGISPPPPPPPPPPPAATVDSVTYQLGQTSSSLRSVTSNTEGTSNENSSTGMNVLLSGNSSWTETRTASGLTLSLTTPNTNIWQWFKIVTPTISTLELNDIRYHNISLTGAADATVTLNRAMSGTVVTGNGNDTISITLAQLTTTSALQTFNLNTGLGDDDVLVYGNLTASRIIANLGDGANSIAAEATYRGSLVITSGNGDDVLSGGAGADNFAAGGGVDTLNGLSGNDVLRGGAGNDLVSGDIGADSLYGDDGNDTLYGGNDNDNMFGGNDIDTLYGDAGNDTIYGDAGDDSVYGGVGNDNLYGGLNNDTVYGGDGDDRVYGQGGNDVLYGGIGNDRMDGGTEDDTLYGENGNDIMLGGTGNDSLTGGAGVDTLYGNDGNDVLDGGAGAADYYYGGNGADTFFMQDAGAVFDFAKDFSATQGDVLVFSGLLSGFDAAQNDIDNFVRFTYRTTTRTDIYINADGQGNDWVVGGMLNTNTRNVTVQGLFDNDQIVVI